MTTNQRPLNPYDFVPLETQPEPAEHPDRSVERNLTGIILFDIHVLTPLCVLHDPGVLERETGKLAHLDEGAILPATSLKGALRAVHEVVTNSSMGAAKRGVSIPVAYRPGEPRQKLSPSEALFGRVGGKGKDSVGDAGRILWKDVAIPPATIEIINIRRPQRGGRPQPEHRKFYFYQSKTGQDIPLGRKFYYHQNYLTLRDTIYNRRSGTQLVSLQAVRPTTVLPAELRFLGISRDELATLVYTLVLEDHLAHKIGYGKPLGLGSTQIKITKLYIEPDTDGIPERFRSYREVPKYRGWMSQVPILAAAARNAWLQRSQGQASYDAFTAIAHWQQDVNYAYPEKYGFFDTPEGKVMPLWEYQGRTAYHPGQQLDANETSTPQEAVITSVEAAATSTDGIATSTDSVAKPEDVTLPVKTIEPFQPIQLRTIGQARIEKNGEAVVLSADGRRYLITVDSAPRAILQPLIEQLSAGEAVQVHYRSDRQRINNQYRNIAVEVEPVREPNP